MLGLYLHVPFCAAICNYCNFNRGLFDGALKIRYVEALDEEIRRSAERGRAADTIFFGGGTPSLLEPPEIARLIAQCRSSFELADSAEITLEANPETVSIERLTAFRRAGINRLSYGVQSLRDDELKRLSRLHGANRARQAVAEARAAGFDNLSLDLMMWLPGQQVVDWLATVSDAVQLQPDHVSLYLLEVYPNAPLREEMARSRWSQAPDEDAAEMYLSALDRLDQAGYEQYEISNVARPGRRSRHNWKYWTDGEWVGFGCGAHSTVGGMRWKNVAGIEEFIDRVHRGDRTAVEVRPMTADERLGDALFTGLRLAEGLDEDAIRSRYGVDLWERFGADLEPFRAAGILRRDGGRVRLTRQGMLLANEVMSVFV
jgi:oxygen-independent coproporphyrinogen III oxidase